MVKLLLNLKQPKRDICGRIICKMEEIIQQIFQLHIFVCVCLKQNRNLNFFQTTKRKTGKKKGGRKEGGKKRKGKEKI